MNEGRKYHVRMELIKRLDSQISEVYRTAESIQDDLYDGRLTYEDAERLLGIGACDNETIMRLNKEAKK